MKPMRQSKNAFIQLLLARGLKPRAEVLARGLSASEARKEETRLIAEHKKQPWNCNTANGGEGCMDGPTYNVYGLFEPWPGGRCFYIGLAVDVQARVKAQIAEAATAVITLTKNPNLAGFLAAFLNGWPGAEHIIEQHINEPIFQRMFFHTMDEYLNRWKKWKEWAGDDCTEAEAGTLRFGRWIMHGTFTRPEFARVVGAFSGVSWGKALANRTATNRVPQHP